MSENGPVVPEVSTRLLTADRTLYEWRCTPDDLEALVYGRLHIEGMQPRGSIEVAHVGDDYELRIAEIDPLAKPAVVRNGNVEIPSAEQFTDLFRAMFAAVDARHEDGGMHAAGLARDGIIAFQAEDVGRHNVVDKAIGMAAMEAADIPSYGMLVTSRISGEIARKAARSGVRWLASRSIPTTLAVQIARNAGMPIIGRAAGKRAHIYR